MKVTASLNNLRIAPRKTKILADLIRGIDTQEALNQLGMNIRRSSEPMKKLLDSAIANAENNFGLDKDNLYIYDVLIGAGPSLKRWMPRAYGRAGKILKRTSKITIVLDERIEGKGRKTKEQMAKEQEDRLKEKKKREKELMGNAEDKKAEEVKAKKTTETEREKDKTKKEGGKKGWGSKIFRRKSM
jgi:large subunit ribosomal protein L22